MRLSPIRLALLALFAVAPMFVISCGEEPVQPVPTASVTTTAAQGAVPQEIAFSPAFDALSFDQPVFITWVPGPADRLAVVEQTGRVFIFENREEVSQASELLDISSKVKSGGEEGMLGLAFDPGFEQNGYFYVYYSASNPRRSVISRFTAGDFGRSRTEPGTEKIILEVTQPQAYGNHKAGMLAFGPDGKLYIALGDGGGSGDPVGNGQSLQTLLGKILRIDPAAGDPYVVPSDNPFAGDAGARGEIWAYGFRNPYRFSFDRLNGNLWAGDVGEVTREEIDLVVKGGNYGWNIYEGTTEFENPAGRPPGDFLQPVIEYQRSLGRSVIGGYVYRGSRVPSAKGVYFYADFYSGRIWALQYLDGAAADNREIARIPSVSSFGEDRSGELYITLHETGKILRLAEAG